MTALYVVLLVLALFGLPLYMVIGGFAMLMGIQLAQTPAAFFTQGYGMLADSPTLVSIPLFTFAGYLMAESKTGGRLVRLFDALLGWLPGGLTIQIVVVCSFFTIFTGASGVTIIALGMLLYPVLLKSHYPEEYALGLLTASGSLGLLLPPSLPLIIYGVIAKTDIRALFWAGILPGLLMMAVLVFHGIWVNIRNNPDNPGGIVEYFKALGKALALLAVLVLVGFVAFRFIPMGALMSIIGIVTLAFFAFSIFFPKHSAFEKYQLLAALHESKWEAALPLLIGFLLLKQVVGIPEIALLTTAYIFVVEVFIYRDLGLFRDIPRVSFLSLKLVGSIILILMSALALSNLLILQEVPDKLFEAIKPVITNKWMFLLALNIFLLLVGCLLDIFSAILVVVPLVVPLANRFGVDPVHLGIVFLANLELGYMTPPVGINLFISSMTFKKPVLTLYRVSLPFLGLLAVALVMITYIPALSLWLPQATGATQRALPNLDKESPSKRRENLMDLLKEEGKGEKKGEKLTDPDDDDDDDKPKARRTTPPTKAPATRGGEPTVGDGGPLPEKKPDAAPPKEKSPTRRPPPKRSSDEDDEEP
ncbi:MAG: TRAP transporter large permease subunit [Myxococcales bacterium]|nr:TRAP transporter large permease subunit [Myxococcales bacterium]MCB9642502.1 TRAP transporter large permease subunit [Myxococcales bacterium]